MSDLKLKSIHKLFRVAILCIKYAKNTNTDEISLHIRQLTI